MKVLPYYDSHCHLDADRFAEDLDAVIDRARDASVERMITIGTGLASAERAVTIAERYPEIYAAVAIDPHSAKDFSTAVIEALREMSDHEKVVAIGETGLDYHYFLSPKEDQQRSFRAHIQLAKETNLPLVIHNRKAEEDILRLLSEEDPGNELTVVIHCFDADAVFAQRCIDRDCYISFSGLLTFKKRQDLRETLPLVPRHRLLAETDAPYLAPVPHRGKRNEPAFVISTFRLINELRNDSLPETVATLRRNLTEAFGI